MTIFSTWKGRTVMGHNPTNRIRLSIVRQKVGREVNGEIIPLLTLRLTYYQMGGESPVDEWFNLPAEKAKEIIRRQLAEHFDETETSMRVIRPSLREVLDEAVDIVTNADEVDGLDGRRYFMLAYEESTMHRSDLS